MSAERSLLMKTFDSSSFSLWTVLFFCLFWTSAQGQYHLIGSSEPIVAAPGDDVILPCRVDPGWNAERKTVEWSKPDLKVDPSGKRRGVEYVFVYRFQSPDRDIMMASYIQRTSLSSEGLRHGDVSLRLRNVTQEDNGRFRCFIPNLKIHAEVLLLVDPNFVSTTPSEPSENTNLITLDPQDQTDDPAGLRSRTIPLVTFLLLFFLCIGWLCKVSCCSNKKQKSSDPESSACPLTQVPCSKAEDGSAGSDQLDPLSCSDIRCEQPPDLTRVHG